MLHDLVYSLLTADLFFYMDRLECSHEPRNQRNLHSPKSSDLGSYIIAFSIMGVTLSTTMTHTPLGIAASQPPSAFSLRACAFTSSFLPCCTAHVCLDPRHAPLPSSTFSPTLPTRLLTLTHSISPTEPILVKVPDKLHLYKPADLAIHKTTRVVSAPLP